MDNIDKYMNENYQLNILKIEDDGDNYYKVSVPDLPGLIIYVDSLKDIKDELEESKKEWFTSRLKQGKNIPLPRNDKKSGRITLRIPKSLHAELESNASEEKVSLNSYINYLIECGLRNSLYTSSFSHTKIIDNIVESSEISKFEEDNIYSFDINQKLGW